MADAFRELRSMILLELCCPPLPVMATRQETGQQTVTNTHDMMSVFMIAAFRRQDSEENSRRQVKQVEIEKEYQDGLEMCQTFTQTYAHMARFATDYLATYLLPGAFTKQDIQVLSPDYISPCLREEIRSYCRALRTVAELEAVDLSNHSTNALFMNIVVSAIHKKQQGVVGEPILVSVGDDISEEGNNPKTLEPSIEVL